MILGVHRIAHQHWTRCVDLAGGVFPASLSPGFQLRHSVARISLTDLADMPIVSLPCEHYAYAGFRTPCRWGRVTTTAFNW